MSRALARFAARVIGPDRPHDRVAADAAAVVGPESVRVADDPSTPVPAILCADADADAGEDLGEPRVAVHPRPSGTLVTVCGNDAPSVAHRICAGSGDGVTAAPTPSGDAAENAARFWTDELEGTVGVPAIAEVPGIEEDRAIGVAKGRVPREALGANPVAALVAAVAACTGAPRDSVVGVVPETGPDTWSGQPLPVRVRPRPGQSREDAAAEALARIAAADDGVRCVGLPGIVAALGRPPFPVAVVIRSPHDCGGARIVDDRAPVPEFCLAGIDAVIGDASAVSLSVRARGGQAGARSLLAAVTAAIEGAGQKAAPSGASELGASEPGAEAGSGAPGGAADANLGVLCAAVAEVLDLPEEKAPGPGDDFFRLGGDSMAALRLSAALSARGMSLEVRGIFEHPVLGELAGLMRPGAADGSGTDAAGGAAETAASAEPMSASGLSAEQLSALLGEENR
ncbi:acyl carrier protein [Corynebacterium sp. HMSC11E11]|uniref:acyl carrier protein n=1 Tax=Corynebacterium sp. HMSC11E11 TaxID=1581089 RepID=UPI0008A48EB4|nr:acyl carrier protein [Corynebacterium sp. HMSC11E11]OFU55024.1 hypothetical protein HMPREF3121_06715 [Corynebacterium sp. HMSC11E11]